MGFCQVKNLGVEHLNISIDILNISDIINIDSEGHTYKTRKDLTMVYAKDMNKKAEQVRIEREEEKRKAQDALNLKAEAQARQFCHSTLSSEIDEIAADGRNSLSLVFTEVDTNGHCYQLKYDGEYIEVPGILSFSTIENILADHEYNVTIGPVCDYRTYKGKYSYQNRYRKGRRVTISW